MIQTTSLELSKRLKEKGVEQNAYWSWVTKKERERDKTYLLETDRTYIFKKSGDCWSAFTADEIGEKIKNVGEMNPELSIVIEWNEVYKEWECFLMNDVEEENVTSGDSMAESMGLMLEFLLDNGLLKL